MRAPDWSDRKPRKPPTPPTPPTLHLYRGVWLSPCSSGTQGIQWTAITAKGVARADTLAGIRALVRDAERA